MTMGDAFGPENGSRNFAAYRGWLLLLCIMLMIVFPLSLGFGHLGDNEVANPDAAGSRFSSCCSSLCRWWLGIIAGILLYREQRLGLRLRAVALFGLQLSIRQLRQSSVGPRNVIAALTVVLGSGVACLSLQIRARAEHVLQRTRAGTPPRSSGELGLRTNKERFLDSDGCRCDLRGGPTGSAHDRAFPPDLGHEVPPQGGRTARRSTRPSRTPGRASRWPRPRPRRPKSAAQWAAAFAERARRITASCPPAASSPAPAPAAR